MEVKWDCLVRLGGGRVGRTLGYLISVTPKALAGCGERDDCGNVAGVNCLALFCFGGVDTKLVFV